MILHYLPSFLPRYTTNSVGEKQECDSTTLAKGSKSRSRKGLLKEFKEVRAKQNLRNLNSELYIQSKLR